MSTRADFLQDELNKALADLEAEKAAAKRDMESAAIVFSDVLKRRDEEFFALSLSRKKIEQDKTLAQDLASTELELKKMAGARDLCLLDIEDLVRCRDKLNADFHALDAEHRKDRKALMKARQAIEAIRGQLNFRNSNCNNNVLDAISDVIKDM